MCRELLRSLRGEETEKWGDSQTLLWDQGDKVRNGRNLSKFVCNGIIQHGGGNQYSGENWDNPMPKVLSN